MVGILYTYEGKCLSIFQASMHISMLQATIQLEKIFQERAISVFVILLMFSAVIKWKWKDAILGILRSSSSLSINILMLFCKPFAIKTLDPFWKTITTKRDCIWKKKSPRLLWALIFNLKKILWHDI